MARTFEQTRKDTNAREKFSRRNRSEIKGNFEDITEKTFERLARVPEKGITNRGVDAKLERKSDQIINIENNIDEGVIDDIGFGLTEVNNTINELFEFDLEELGQTDLLRVIAEAARNIAVLEKIAVDQGITAISFLNDIATAVEPASSIVVSGTQQIDNANGNPIPVIPNNDNTTVDVRKLRVRAAPGNSNELYFGDDKVTPENGFFLTPGEATTIDIDFRDSVLWMAGDEGDFVYLLGTF
jgi:hypothetical protein